MACLSDEREQSHQEPCSWITQRKGLAEMHQTRLFSMSFAGSQPKFARNSKYKGLSRGGSRFGTVIQHCVRKETLHPWGQWEKFPAKLNALQLQIFLTALVRVRDLAVASV